MAKLTLSVDATVVSRAKRFAKARGLSLSKIVEAYLAAVVDLPTPVLDSVRGVIKKADLKDYKQHLIAKYR